MNQLSPSGWTEEVAEYANPLSAPVGTYVHGSHGLISQRCWSTVRYCDAYGNLAASTRCTINNYCYTGQPWDP